jgi:hypothetical protein
MSEMIKAVRNWAEQHYAIEGWDYVVEAFDDKQIEKILVEEKCANCLDAIEAVRAVVMIYRERDDERRGEW